MASLRRSPKALLTYIKAWTQFRPQDTTRPVSIVTATIKLCLPLRFHKRAAAKSDELFMPQVLLNSMSILAISKSGWWRRQTRCLLSASLSASVSLLGGFDGIYERCNLHLRRWKGWRELSSGGENNCRLVYIDGLSWFGWGRFEFVSSWDRSTQYPDDAWTRLREQNINGGNQVEGKTLK